MRLDVPHPFGIHYGDFHAAASDVDNQIAALFYLKAMTGGEINQASFFIAVDNIQLDTGIFASAPHDMLPTTAVAHRARCNGANTIERKIACNRCHRSERFYG